MKTIHFGKFTLAYYKLPSFRRNKLLFSLVVCISPFLRLVLSFIFGCTGSRCRGRAFSSCDGFSSCEAQALQCVDFSSFGPRAQELRHPSLVTPWHVESSQTRDRTCVPCINRQIPTHCATREVLLKAFI